MQLFVAALLSLLCTVQAFTAFKGAKSSALFAKSKSVPFLEEPIAISGMVGYKGFDPLGFSDSIDPRFLREAELKHGRVAMLATTGFIFSEFLKLPGEIHNVSPVAAHDLFVGTGAMAQIFFAVTALESVSIIAIKEMMAGSGRAPGDYGLEFVGCSTDQAKETMQLKELENGRLAMVAFSGIVTQAVLLNKGFPYY